MVRITIPPKLSALLEESPLADPTRSALNLFAEYLSNPNTAMYFFGMQSIRFLQMEISVYDIVVAVIALLLTGFFVNTALRDAFNLAALGE